MAKIGAATTCACLFVFLVLFSATQVAEAVVEEKRSCQSQSHKFKGKCFSDSNCGSVCQTEGFPSGKCRGIRQRCFCTRPC